MNQPPELAPRPRGWALAFGLMLLGVLLTALYWALWFFGDPAWLVSQDTPLCYAFERAFPLADTWLAGVSFAGALGLYFRWRATLLYILLAGSSSVYLGCLDVLFDLQNGVYTGVWSSNTWTELGINLLSFGIPAYGLTFAWRARFELLGPWRVS